METHSKLQEERRQLITRWQQSGLSHKEFCIRENISFHQFYYWKKKFCKTEKNSPGKFLKLRSSAALPETIFAEVTLTNGCRIALHKELSIKELKQLAE